MFSHDVDFFSYLSSLLFSLLLSSFLSPSSSPFISSLLQVLFQPSLHSHGGYECMKQKHLRG